MFQNTLRIIEDAIAGGFRTDQGAAIAHALAGQNAIVPGITNAAILSEEVADLTAANSDITGRNVNRRTDVALQFSHERLAETHDLTVAFAMGIEIAASLAAADRKAGQTVLEYLFKAEELEHAERYILMEAKASLVRSKGPVELNTVAAVDLDLSFVIDPGDTEFNDTLRLTHPLQKGGFFIFRMCFNDGSKTREHFFDSLQKFGLRSVFCL